ncbi:neural cell adhesion molecule 1-A-like isoform X1 [Crassostrea angulata]|uniref:neural cell adhesion molecule 1-A-like isoform X1 n=1 Tax=Magallana angulata TaxID=2784310 RepID=UPI0022B10011|nr:neural cell adhesion molecule 1-A-like isoform X1 [Crassostrea angulata]
MCAKMPKMAFYFLLGIFASFNISYSIDPVTVIGESGSNLAYPLECERPTGFNILWLKDLTPIANSTAFFNKDDRYSFKNRYLRDSHLMINSLKKTDEGRYKCELLNGSVISDYMLKLKEEAAIPVSSEPRVSVWEYHEVRLWCNATGVPEPKVTWYVLETTNQQTEALRDIGIQGRMLGIKNVSRDCATKFQCNASNNYNEKKDPVSKVILLDVKFVPDVNIKVKINNGSFSVETSILSDRKDSIELVCDVFANPLTKITWYRNKVKIGHYTVGEDGPEKNAQDRDNNVYTISNIQTTPTEPRFWAFPLRFQMDGVFMFAKYQCEVDTGKKNFVKYIEIKQK